MTKDELIAALEAATGPSRKLDSDIHRALSLAAPAASRLTRAGRRQAQQEGA